MLTQVSHDLSGRCNWYFLKRSSVMVPRCSARGGRPQGYLLSREIRQFFQDQISFRESRLFYRKEPSLLLPCVMLIPSYSPSPAHAWACTLPCFMPCCHTARAKQHSVCSPYPGIPGSKTLKLNNPVFFLTCVSLNILYIIRNGPRLTLYGDSQRD